MFNKTDFYSRKLTQRGRDNFACTHCSFDPLKKISCAAPSFSSYRLCSNNINRYAVGSVLLVKKKRLALHIHIYPVALVQGTQCLDKDQD